MRAIQDKQISNENGAAILMTMITLLVLTVIGISAMQTSTYDIRYSGAEKRKELAFYAADAGIEHAKVFLNDQFDKNEILWEIQPKGSSDSVDVQDYDSYEDSVEVLKNESLGDYKYTVKVWQTVDSQEIIVRSEAQSKDGGSKAAVEIVYWVGETDRNIVKGYTSQALAGEDKSNVSVDETAIRAFDQQLTNNS